MKRTLGIVVAAAVLVALTTGASAEVLSSNTFTMAYGYNGDQIWSVDENASSNIAITGDYGLTVGFVPIAPYTLSWAASGPTFAGGVLADGSSTDGYSSHTSIIITVAGDYTGAVAPQGEITLVIDSISIYAANAAYSNVAGDDMINWAETTAGNVATSSQVNLGPITSEWNVASGYSLVSWNPGDVAVAGESSIRTFVMETETFGVGPADGFTVTGHVEYAAVPEPATLGLLGCGALAMFRRNRR